LSEYVETLVLRLQHETPYTSCPTRDLPRHFNPKRLVLLFKQEPSRKEYGRRDSDTDGCHMVAFGPGEGKDESSNTFYRMAQMALAVGNDCKVYIVAADHAALHLKGMERYDRSLAGFDPLYPHAQKKREEIPLYRRITLPTGAQWEIDDEEPEISRWRSEDGELHHIDEATTMMVATRRISRSAKGRLAAYQLQEANTYAMTKKGGLFRRRNHTGLLENTSLGPGRSSTNG
jgi:hypothetical protein